MSIQLVTWELGICVMVFLSYLFKDMLIQDLLHHDLTKRKNNFLSEWSNNQQVTSNSGACDLLYLLNGAFISVI